MMIQETILVLRLAVYFHLHYLGVDGKATALG